MAVINDADVNPTDEIDVLRITLAKDKNTDKKILGVYSDLEEEAVTEIIVALYEQRMSHIETEKSKLKNNMYGDSDLLKSEMLESGVKIMDPVNKSND